MDREAQVYGLRVMNVIPDDLMKNVNVHSEISIEFDSDLNLGSVKGNIVVLEDPNQVYKTVSDLQDTSKFTPVSGGLKYSDQTLVFTPNDTLKTNTVYIIIANSKITDILGNHLNKTLISTFTTEAVASYKKVSIVGPKYGEIVSSLPEIVWKNVGAPSYFIEFAKMNSFEVLCFQGIVPWTEEDLLSYLPTFNVTEGIYYVRIKPENSAEWSDPLQFFIKPITDALVATEDEPMDLREFMSGLEAPLEILEVFPPEDSVNVSLKTNMMFIRIRGKIDEDDINFQRSFVQGLIFSETDSVETEHLDVNGSWSIVYDGYYDETYVIFTPISLEEKIEQPVEEENGQTE